MLSLSQLRRAHFHVEIFQIGILSAAIVGELWSLVRGRKASTDV